MESISNSVYVLINKYFPFEQYDIIFVIVCSNTTNVQRGRIDKLIMGCERILNYNN